MMIVGRWRWPLTVGLPLLVGAGLVASGVTRLHDMRHTVLGFTGPSADMDNDFKMFQSGLIQKRVEVALGSRAMKMSYDRVPGHKSNIIISSDGIWPKEVVKTLETASQIYRDQAVARRKTQIHKEVEALQPLKTEAELRFNAAVQQRDVYLASHHSLAPRRDASAKIKALQTRRQLLIEYYPTHTDIPLLAKEIKNLQNQESGHAGVLPAKLTDLDRLVNESKLWWNYRTRILEAATQQEKNLKSAWQVVEPVQEPQWPLSIEHFPLLMGIVVGIFILGCLLLRGEFKPRKGSAADGLWKPVEPKKAAEPKNETEPVKPVELTVVSAEPEPEPEPATPAVVAQESKLPSDPLTPKAAELYSKWVEVAKVLYAPALDAPQGVIESVGPLMEESIQFLPEGHDVLARYLAHTVAPGDLPAHVARTVLMTLTGAQDAGVSEEHRLAMALAALFHDLAVVPRPVGSQDEVGSDVGRLSASVIRRIPGLEPMMLAMVEDILIGMDEFKLETWQNVANGKSLEPLSKVLREIDRFEKVMQKQKSRLDRQVVQKKAI